MHYNDRSRPRTLLGGLATGLTLGALAAVGGRRLRRPRARAQTPDAAGVRRFRL